MNAQLAVQYDWHEVEFNDFVTPRDIHLLELGLLNSRPQAGCLHSQTGSYMVTTPVSCSIAVKHCFRGSPRKLMMIT